MNKERGEHRVTIGGVEYLLRPSHEAMAVVEEKSGKGILLLGQLLSQAAFSANDITAVLWGSAYTVLDGKMPVKYEEFGKLCYKAGIGKLSFLAINLLGTMLSGETEEERAEKNESSTDTVKKSTSKKKSKKTEVDTHGESESA